jgi:uncharacterized phiE125 gp8 family phage protein
MAIRKTVEPAIEPISLALVHLQVKPGGGTAEDELLELYIAAAREEAEQRTRLALITQTWEQTLDAFPCSGGGEIKLLKPPVQEIVSVQYVDTNGDVQTLPDTSYVLDARVSPGWLLPADGTTWPATAPVIDAVTITLRVGFGSQPLHVPASIRHWMLMAVTTSYENRGKDGKVVIQSDDYVDRKLDGWINYAGV